MVAISAGALEGVGVVDVRFGSLADILRCGIRFSGDCDRKSRHRLKGRMLLSSATGVQPCKTMQTSPYLHLKAPLEQGQINWSHRSGRSTSGQFAPCSRLSGVRVTWRCSILPSAVNCGAATSSPSGSMTLLPMGTQLIERRCVLPQDLAQETGRVPIFGSKVGAKHDTAAVCTTCVRLAHRHRARPSFIRAHTHCGERRQR